MCAIRPGEASSVSGSDDSRGEPASRRGSGLVPPPRAYFGQAAAGIRRPASDLGAGAARPARRLVFRTLDPALRLFADLPEPALDVVDGAAITLSGAADGDAEWLLIDVSGTALRRETRRDPAQGTVILALTGTQAAASYRPLLATLRYLNRSPAPQPGLRRITIELIDPAGERHALAEAAVALESAAPTAAEPADDGPVPPDPAPRDTPPATGDAAPAAGAMPGPPEAAAVREKPAVRGEPVAREAPAARREEAAHEKPRIADNRLAIDATDGGYTLFWWPPAPPRRGARPATGAKAPDPAAAHPSFFSAGGRVYRLFAPRPGAPDPGVPETGAADLAAVPPVATPPQEGDRLWTAGGAQPSPGLATPPMLRLEDVFGSDMADALTRRVIEQRLAAGR